MRFWVGVTDNRWFAHIQKRNFDEVNFWQPSARPPFTSLDAGTPFLFKLKRPNNCIAGGGYFVRFTTLPLSLAWDVFGEQNGADTLREFGHLIESNFSGGLRTNPEIGCTVLTGVFFLPESKWIPVENLFSGNIVRGRTYDDRDEDGAELWHRVEAARSALGVREPQATNEGERYGRAFLARARLGQGAFRTLVTDAYQRRCAITGETTLPVLEAAHIRPYSDDGPHSVSNGLLMRSDFHKLFDVGLVTVEPDHTIRVSGRIRDQWYNGKAYYRLDRNQLAVLPENELDRPNSDYLRWHNNERFVE